MRVAVLPSVTSGWHGNDVTRAEAVLWPERFKVCPVCGERFAPRGRKAYCSRACKKMDEGRPNGR